MNICLFTPAIRQSAIGACSALVEDALVRQGHTVNVVRTEHVDLLETPTLNFVNPIARWTDISDVSRLIQDSEAVVYQIGDNYQYHAGALRWLDQAPGLVLLHDFFLPNLVAGWMRQTPPPTTDIVSAWYGASIAEDFYSSDNIAAFLARTNYEVTMLEPVCAKARAVITHSHWGCDWVLRACPGPICVVPLPQLSVEKPPQTAELQRQGDRLRILTIGHVNANKRAESVIMALARSAPLREAYCYRLVGHVDVERREELSKLASKYGVDLVILGEVDEPTLRNELDGCDVVSCLRWPTLEAASSSLVQALLHARATIVTDAGFYREIPPECVLKVRPEHESDDLRDALGRLARDAELRKSLGNGGRQWCLATFTAENYAVELISTIELMASAEPVIQGIEHYADMMRGWNSSVDILQHDAVVDPLRIFGKTMQ